MPCTRTAAFTSGHCVATEWPLSGHCTFFSGHCVATGILNKRYPWRSHYTCSICEMCFGFVLSDTPDPVTHKRSGTASFFNVLALGVVEALASSPQVHDARLEELR